MILNVFGTSIEFTEYSLEMREKDLTDIFARKNNKTLYETVYNENQGNKYLKYKQIIDLQYSGYKHFPLGEFLIYLKKRNDLFYMNFLNKYGDGKFCNFTLTDKNLKTRKGLYFYRIDNEIMYIGRCLDSFWNRVNLGYGKISPKNCYIDGQQTNCYLNSLVNCTTGELSFYICSMIDNDRIKDAERHLIGTYNPTWNKALRTK